MELNKILQSITLGLTGDRERDLVYLREKCEEYKDHPYSKEIARACGRLMGEILPDEKKDEMFRLFNNARLGIDAFVKEIQFNIYEKNFEKAFSLSEGLVSKLEVLPIFDNDAASEYYTFPNERRVCLEVALPFPCLAVEGAGGHMAGLGCLL